MAVIDPKAELTAIPLLVLVRTNFLTQALFDNSGLTIDLVKRQIRLLCMLVQGENQPCTKRQNWRYQWHRIDATTEAVINE